MWHGQGKWVVEEKKYQILSFLSHFLIISKCFILMPIPLKLDIWLQICEVFVNVISNVEQKNSVFAIISKAHSPWSCHIAKLAKPVCWCRSPYFEVYCKVTKTADKLRNWATFIPVLGQLWNMQVRYSIWHPVGHIKDTM